MPGSVVLDTTIGLVFVFLATSLICSAAVEWLGNKLNKRGEFLLRGLREMLDIPPATPEEPDAAGTVEPTGTHGLIEKDGRRRRLQLLSTEGVKLRDELAGGQQTVTIPAPLADLVLAHPNIAALHRPALPGQPSSTPGGSRPRRYPWKPDPDEMHLASYVSAQAFTRSLLDLLVPDGVGRATTITLGDHIGRLPTAVPARDALLALLRDAGDDVGAFRRAVEQWYDEQMGRVSGWYKRWAQRRLLVAGAVLAVVMNVDSIAIARALYQDEPVRTAVVAQALSAQGCPGGTESDPQACLTKQQDVLRKMSLPLGWDVAAATTECRQPGQGAACWPGQLWEAVTGAGFGGILLKLLGWLLTAAAVSFGAPFWFDSLSKLGSLRTAGRRPGENAPYNASR
ncbi:MAG TPA: hypothetical protein VHN18_11405 [Micromonosporaceae bacterium]|nr:hypothetical protein [Micromonosporaceae bacterium]